MRNRLIVDRRLGATFADQAPVVQDGQVIGESVDELAVPLGAMVEYRITSWLALLGTVSTIGRDSVLVQVSRDY